MLSSTIIGDIANGMVAKCLRNLGTWHFNNLLVSFSGDKAVFDETLKGKFKKIDFSAAQIVLPNL